MVERVCPKCKAKLRIDENDAIPGCREFEEVYCPVCQAEVTKVFIIRRLFTERLMKMVNIKLAWDSILHFRGLV